MDNYELIITRRSTRKYKDTPLDKELIDKIIDTGRHAPSGGNSQTTRFFVITDREFLDNLAVTAEKCFARMEVTEGMYRSTASAITRAKKGGYIFHYNAPLLIVLANKKTYGNNIADCACALENMMIFCNGEDLGSCWINQLKWLNEEPEILEIFRAHGLEDDERIYGALAVGYPDTEDGLPSRTPLPRTGNPVEYL